MKRPKQKTISFRGDDALQKKINVFCATHGMKKLDFLRAAIEAFIRGNK